MAAAVEIPEFEPGAKMVGEQSEGKMLERHGAGVQGGTARRARPKFRDFQNVGAPIVNRAIENGPDDRVLADVRIE